MTLAPRGTRIIVVDGVVYRWTVAPDDEPGLGIVVEHAKAPGQRLAHWVDHGTITSPRLVREAIVEGLRAGWAPTAKGRDVVRRSPLGPAG
jgi:hypothetical protein